jgi:predicted ATPase
MLDVIASTLLAGSALAVTLKVAAVVAGFGLGVRLLAAGGGTADDRDRVLVEAARGHRPASEPNDGVDPAIG